MDEKPKELMTFNDRLNAMSTKKKAIIIIFMLAIFGSVFYLTTLDKHVKIEYKQHDKVVCTEHYINGELNGSSCEQYYPREKWQPTIPLDISENWTLTQNQS